MRKAKKKQDPAPQEEHQELDEAVEAKDASSVERADESNEERLQRELDEANDNWKRALADYKNLRKRTLVDIESAVRASKQGLLSELLLVLDYLEMALQTQCETQEGKNLLFGVEMTRDQMIKFLESQDVKPLESEGAFDPELHQAVETVETAEFDEGQIVETVRRGYKCGEFVLRYAQVKVAAAPGSAEAEEELEDSAEA